MEAKYTCKAVKYAPESGSDVALIIQFDVEKEALRNFVTQHFPADIFVPAELDPVIATLLGRGGIYLWNFTGTSRIFINDKYNYEIHSPVGIIRGWISENDLREQNVECVEDYLGDATFIELIITNSLYKEVDQYAAYCFDVKLGK